MESKVDWPPDNGAIHYRPALEMYRRFIVSGPFILRPMMWNYLPLSPIDLCARRRGFVQPALPIGAIALSTNASEMN